MDNASGMAVALGVARALAPHVARLQRLTRDARQALHDRFPELPRGSLVVSGSIQSRLLYDIAVVGGTGLYDNARGTLTVTSTGLRPLRREVLLFRLTG